MDDGNRSGNDGNKCNDHRPESKHRVSISVDGEECRRFSIFDGKRKDPRSNSNGTAGNSTDRSGKLQEFGTNDEFGYVILDLAK